MKYNSGANHVKYMLEVLTRIMNKVKSNGSERNLKLSYGGAHIFVNIYYDVIRFYINHKKQDDYILDVVFKRHSEVVYMADWVEQIRYINPLKVDVAKLGIPGIDENISIKNIDVKELCFMDTFNVALMYPETVSLQQQFSTELLRTNSDLLGWFSFMDYKPVNNISFKTINDVLIQHGWEL